MSIIKRLFKFKIFVFLLFMSCLISPCFTQNNSDDYMDYEIIIEFEKSINELILEEEKLVKDGRKKERTIYNAFNDIKRKWEKIIWTQLLPAYFENIKPENPKRLPSCVIEAMNELLSKKTIKFKFSTNDDLSFVFPGDSTGALRLYDKDDKAIELGEYDPDSNEITIYGIYKPTYYRSKKDWEEGKGHCTASLLFHELIHQSIRKAKNNMDLKEKFCVKIESTDKIDCIDPKTGEKYKYDAKRCTNKENMDWDEGIAKDCEMKVFSCGKHHMNLGIKINLFSSCPVV